MIRPTDEFGSQLVRFGVVGLFNTAFAYGVYAAFIAIGSPVPAATLCSLVMGIFVSYRSQSRLVFRQHNPGRFLPFVLVWVVLYVVNTALIQVFIAHGLDAYTAGAAAVPPTTMLSFVCQKYLVFRTRAPRPQEVP